MTTRRPDKIKRRLASVRWVAIPKLILLISLVTASRLGNSKPAQRFAVIGLVLSIIVIGLRLDDASLVCG